MAATRRLPPSSQQPLLERVWDFLLAPHGRDGESLSVAAYLSWLFPLAYGAMRLMMVSRAHALGADALLDAARVAAVVGLPLAVLGMACAVLAYLRREPRLWLAIGALSLCAAIVVFSFLEMSGVLLRILTEHLPGVQESLAS